MLDNEWKMTLIVLRSTAQVLCKKIYLSEDLSDIFFMFRLGVFGEEDGRE